MGRGRGLLGCCFLFVGGDSCTSFEHFFSQRLLHEKVVNEHRNKFSKEARDRLKEELAKTLPQLKEARIFNS